jgi:hypothetical protein
MSTNKTSYDYEALMRDDPSFLESHRQITAAWNSRFDEKPITEVFVHPAIKAIDWRDYGVCYGNFYDEQDVKPKRSFNNNNRRAHTYHK